MRIDSHGSLSLATSCLCVHSCAYKSVCVCVCVCVCVWARASARVHVCKCVSTYAYPGWYYLPPCFPPSQKINHPDVSLFCCWLFLTLYIKQKHLSLSLSLSLSLPCPYGNVFFVNGHVVSGGRPARVGFIFHLQFDFKQTRLMKLYRIWEDLSFSSAWSAKQKDSSTVTSSQCALLFLRKSPRFFSVSGSHLSDHVYWFAVRWR